MTLTDAANLLRELRGRGVDLQGVGDRLRYRPLTAVNRDLLERMVECKSELLALLERFEERAAILEFDAGLPRAEAERQAGLFPASGLQDPEASCSVGWP